MDPGEKSAAAEERMLDHKDDHGLFPQAGKDIRPKGINEYNQHTYKRITALLKAGKITEGQGTVFKNQQTIITKELTAAKQDGTITADELKSLRSQLDKLNDNITTVAGTGEEGSERTPLLNRQQHRLEESIQSGEKSGRLSTLEASSLRRKLAKLNSLEDKLKTDKEITQKEREKLFEEANELRREFKKALFD